MLYQRRPIWLQDKIDRAFAEVQGDDFINNYSYHGQGSYDFLGYFVNSTALISHASERLGRAVRVLDVGTGAGALVLHALESGHDAQGITAHDYRKTEMSRNLGDDNYIVGDAHQLLEMPGVQSRYDVVLSRWTLRHLVDPLSVMEQMASVVEDGGVIAFDNTRSRQVQYRTRFGTVYDGHDFAEDMEEAGFVLHPFTQQTTQGVPRGQTFFVSDFVAEKTQSSQATCLSADYPAEAVGQG